MLCTICKAEVNAGEELCAICGAPVAAGLDAQTLYLEHGSELDDGQYVVQSVLGRGGFGITYQGRNHENHQPVAIKEFFPEGCRREGRDVVPPAGATARDFHDSMQRFIAEAHILQGFDHPNIVRVFDVFEGNSTFYLVMSYLQGETLDETLRKRGRFSETDGIEYVRAIASALLAVHEKGFIHGDVKPANIMLCNTGRIVLFDFGTAMHMTHDAGRRASPILTPGYAALEQYGRETQIGPYTDVHGLAATLYHLLTGSAPPPANDRIAGVTFPAPHEVCPDTIGRALSGLVLKALAIEIDQRPPTMEAFLQEINRYSLSYTQLQRGPLLPEYVGDNQAKVPIIFEVPGFVWPVVGAILWFLFYFGTHRS